MTRANNADWRKVFSFNTQSDGLQVGMAWRSNGAFAPPACPERRPSPPSPHDRQHRRCCPTTSGYMSASMARGPLATRSDLAGADAETNPRPRSFLPPPLQITPPNATARSSSAAPSPPSMTATAAGHSLGSGPEVGAAMETLPIISDPQSPLSSLPVTTHRKEGSVRVAVRIRPMLPKEIATNTRACVQHDRNTVQLPTNQKCFTFDHVFPGHVNQGDLYEEALSPLMDSFLQGFNVTVIAYGQTGSGKTYTMGNANATATLASRLFSPQFQPESQDSDDTGPQRNESLPEHEGLIPRFVQQLFSRLDEDKSSSSNQVTVSFLEIYGEEIHDLLGGTKSTRDNPDNLQLRESKAGVWVQGLTEVKVTSQKEAMEQMHVGSLRRITGSTEMNEHSSRSHAVYTVKIVRRMKQGISNNGKIAVSSKTPSALPPPSGRRSSSGRLSFSVPRSDQEMRAESDDESTVVSKLTFVDLAGSERLKKTQAGGNRMKEGIQINVGLLALGNVINALGDDRRRSNPQQHVPYRSSKLTRLLQDALGGNSRTLFIACISPAESNASETLNTLQYANRAKNIQNKAIKNVDVKSAELAGLRALNILLRRELIKARFLQNPDAEPVQLERMIDQLLRDPTVLAYLERLEHTASLSNGLVTLSPAITSVFTSMVSHNGVGEDYPSSTETDVLSDGGSSIALMEDRMDDIGEQGCRFTLHELCKTLEIITLNLELQHLATLGSKTRQTTLAREAYFEACIQKKNSILCAWESSVQRMAASNNENRGATERNRLLDHGMRQLEVIRSELIALQNKKDVERKRLDDHAARIGLEMKKLHGQIQTVRDNDSSGRPETNPIDVLFQVSDIKRRFALKELSDASRTLDQCEQIHAAFLDDEAECLAYSTTLMPRDKGGKDVEEIFAMIRHELQVMVGEEDLQASLAQVLRERSQVVQKILLGWAGPMEGHPVNEEAFLAANEQNLRICEESIRHLSDTLKARQHPVKNLARLVDSVDSIDSAKALIKRLVEEIYGQKRIYLAYFNKENQAHEDPNPLETEAIRGSAIELVALKEAHEAQIQKLQGQHERELLVALEMSSGRISEADSDKHAQLAVLSKKCTESETKVRDLEATQQSLSNELASKNEEISGLHSEISSLRSTLESLKMKEDAFEMMERCHNIWRELGLSPQDQAGKFKDINDMLMKKCCEELEGLEAARKNVQERIEGLLSVIRSLESILAVEHPVDVALIRSNHGTTLLEQERCLIDRRMKLEDELLQRLNARTHGMESIKNLVEEMGIKSIRDFRHYRVDTPNINIDHMYTTLQELDTWKSVLQCSNPAQSFLESKSLNSMALSEISTDVLQRDGQLLNALLREKAKRIAEMEDVLSRIRSLLQVMEFSHDDLHFLLKQADNRAIYRHATSADEITDIMSSIMRKGGKINVSIQDLNYLAAVVEHLTEIYDGRSNSVSFYHATMAEASKVTQSTLESSGLQKFFQVTEMHSNQNADSHQLGCSLSALKAGAESLKTLSDPVERVIRAILFSMNDAFAAFGIETEAQRVSFFLGSDDTVESTKRNILEKYVHGLPSHGTDSGIMELHDSFLSDMDPAFEEFGRYMSPTYGTSKLSQLKAASADVIVINTTIQAANKRLESLQRIMKLFSEINDFKKKIEEFEASACQKDRLFGSSLRLLEEERFRKIAAKRYPNLLASLRREVEKWIENEGGEYDLSILGQEMKTLLVDMMNTDTGLMHLDLGVLDASRPSARRMSKSAGTPGLPPAPTATSTVALPRSRPGSALSRDVGSKKRLVSE